MSTGPVTWEALGDELEQIAAEPDGDRRAAEYERVLSGLAPGGEGWAETLMCLAEERKLAGRLDDARDLYRQAFDDGGRTVLDAQAGLLDVALAAGDDARADELLGLLLTRSRNDELVVGDYEWIGEQLEAAGRLRQALRWFTIPVRDLQPGATELMPITCLDGRFRVRRALDLPLDAYDDAHDVWHELNDGLDQTPTDD